MLGDNPSNIREELATDGTQLDHDSAQRPLVLGDTHSSCASSSGKEEKLIAMLSLPVDAVGFSVRARNVFRRTRIKLLLHLTKTTKGRLLSKRNCGRKTLEEIESVLNQFGLRLNMNLSASIYRGVKRRSEQSALDELRRDYPVEFNKLKATKFNRIPATRLDFYRKCFDIYTQIGTLQGAAKLLNLTRERVRQILVKGTRLGLFEYKSRNYVVFISKEKLLGDCRRCLSLGKVSAENGISLSHLRKALATHKIKINDVTAAFAEGRKDRCIAEYHGISSELGHHPTTTELQRKKGWRYLSMKINRLWGSFDAFREQLGIPKPPQGSPSFREDTRKWREHRRQIALVIRMERLDAIRDCLKQLGTLSAVQIANECNLRPRVIPRLLNLLLATGEIKRVGFSTLTRYRLENNRG